ncbi:MAG: hypothetical protein ACW9W9_00885 [Candidatus Nitrosopumilus sp. Bin_571-38]|mgnify:FL=1|jgi:uncharacterized membrane protein
MMNTQGIFKTVVMLFGIVLGAGAGELVEYVIWIVGDYAVPYCTEQDLPSEYHEMCLKNLGNYNEYKPYFQLVGVIVGLIVAVAGVNRFFK